MQLEIWNILYFIGRLAPIMMVSFFVLVSIFNQDYKGVFYLGGVIVACVCTILLSHTLETLFDISKMSQSCTLSGNLVSRFPLSSVVLGYSIVYIIAPMLQTYGEINNTPLVLLMIAIIFVDVLFLARNDCVRMVGLPTALDVALPIFMSYSLGGFFAFLFILVATSTDASNLLYFGSMDSGPLCNMPSSTTMRCKVYKNGELITAY